MSREALLQELRSLPSRQRIITALDVPTEAEALQLAERLGPDAGFVKVGLELFSAAGPGVVSRLQDQGRRIFLDLKYHDIPNTVASAARIAAGLGAALCTIHAAAGRRALTAAAEALAEAAGDGPGPRPALLAVTVLTSLSEAELRETAPTADTIQERIDRLAKLAWDCGCDGVVCSAADLHHLRAAIGTEPLVVTPGIRPRGSGKDDQQRVTTPGEAVAGGADFLVIGRPITRADDPGAALAAIAADMD